MSPRHSFMYEQTDIPAGMTMDAWRRASAKPRRQRGLARLLRPAVVERRQRGRRTDS
jgi:hypothetical protein